jgi:hypothetical protein
LQPFFIAKKQTNIGIMNIAKQFNKLCILLAAVCLPLLLISCTGYGPKTIERDHMDYGISVRNSVKEQLLANIVGLRYMEAPVFVDVSSVINQYSLSGNVQAGVGFNNAFVGGDSGTVGAGGRWEDRPTITYTPISGKKFSESLLTPVPPEALFALVQSGWPSDLMFRMTVAAINGVEDANSGKQADPDYRELLLVWNRLRDARAIGLRRSNADGATKPQIVVYVNKDNDSEQIQQDLAFMRRVLKLDSADHEYTLAYGLIQSETNEIAVLTQSILDIMVDLAWEINVPQEHVDSGRTRSTFIDTGLGGSLFQVHSSEERPKDAYVAVQNRGYWFYIDDHDMISKRTFGILQILMSLTDAGETARGPIVSIGG